MTVAVFFQESFVLISFFRKLRVTKFEFIRWAHLLWYAYVQKRMSNIPIKIKFQCNICGDINYGYPIDVYDREKPSCQQCGSNMRMRAIVDLLTKTITGKSVVLSSLKPDKDIKGLGLSDCAGYSALLTEKFDYINTWLHKEPQLDITDIDICEHEKYDFVISSEILEHINPPVIEGVKNLRRMLKKDGFCLITVPFMNFDTMLEHYPDLHEYSIVDNAGGAYLLNTTIKGEQQKFTNLKFHGGDGATLELRCFTRSSLHNELLSGGFNDVVFHRDSNLKFGINWPVNWSLPVMAFAGSAVR